MGPEEWIERYGRSWEEADGSQQEVRVRFGRPVIDGNRAAVEWWTTMVDTDDGEITLPGILMLRFAEDGRCEELRECWHSAPGRIDPPEGWGR